MPLRKTARGQPGASQTHTLTLVALKARLDEGLLLCRVAPAGAPPIDHTARHQGHPAQHGPNHNRGNDAAACGAACDGAAGGREGGVAREPALEGRRQSFSSGVFRFCPLGRAVAAVAVGT